MTEDLKGRHVKTPDGGGDVVETIGDNVEVKLDNGEIKSYLSEDVSDDSSAG